MVRIRNARAKATHRAEVAHTKRLEAEVHAEAAIRAAGDGPSPDLDARIGRARAAANIADTAAELAAAWAKEATGPDVVPARLSSDRAHNDALEAWEAVHHAEDATAASRV